MPAEVLHLAPFTDMAFSWCTGVSASLVCLNGNSSEEISVLTSRRFLVLSGVTVLISLQNDPLASHFTQPLGQCFAFFIVYCCSAASQTFALFSTFMKKAFALIYHLFIFPVNLTSYISYNRIKITFTLIRKHCESCHLYTNRILSTYFPADVLSCTVNMEDMWLGLPQALTVTVLITMCWSKFWGFCIQTDGSTLKHVPLKNPARPSEEPSTSIMWFRIKIKCLEKLD